MRPLLPFLLVALCGCSTYRGSAHDGTPEALDAPGWTRVAGVPFVPQATPDGCGPAALAMVTGFWGDGATLAGLAHACGTHDGGGVPAGRLREAARGRGFSAYVVPGSVDLLARELARRRPVLVGLLKPHAAGGLAHYEVVVALNLSTREVATLDPARGLRLNTLDSFLSEWRPAAQLALVVFPPSNPAPARAAALSGGVR